MINDSCLHKINNAKVRKKKRNKKKKEKNNNKINFFSMKIYFFTDFFTKSCVFGIFFVTLHSE